MALYVSTTIDEEDVAAAIRNGDLRLEHILQFALRSDAALDALINDIEPLGGTHEAGTRAARFASAMINN